MSNIVGKTTESTIHQQPDEAAVALLASRRCYTLYDDVVQITGIPHGLSVQAGDHTTGYFYATPLDDPEDFAVEGEGAFDFMSTWTNTFWKASAICFYHLAEVGAEAEITLMPSHLARIEQRMTKAIEKARRYRNIYGSPTENLSRLLKADLTLEEWEDILNEPYG